MPPPWTLDDIPDQHGRTAIVTGSNTGIGFATAAALASRGATVILGVRDTAKGESAASRISDTHPKADIAIQQLDLSSLDSIRSAAANLRSHHPRIDLLINNAGIAHSPLARTRDGFERIFGTNHLGHFALTGLLLPSLLAVPGSRVVSVSALAHQQVTGITFDDLQRERSYKPWQVYSESKLANLLFINELQRRLEDTQTIAVASHPGLSQSDLSRDAPPIQRTLFQVLGPLLLQNATMGALPSLRAAVDPEVHGGEYYGPPGRGVRGHPVITQMSAAARDSATARKLWDVSEQLTNVRYSI